jgi:DNA-binding SARP family transcriptional activator
VAESAAVYFEQRRLAALEECIDLQLALERHNDVIAELNALISEYPLHEKFRCELMLALYRAGRTADAVSTYQAARQTFVTDLGLEPGAAMQKLLRSILGQDARLSLSMRDPRHHGELTNSR